MSFSIDQAEVDQFGTTIQVLAEQDETRLRPTVAFQPVTGKSFTVNRLEGSEAVTKTGRHTDTPTPLEEHSTRYGFMVRKRTVSLLDREDVPTILIQPQSRYARLHANAMNRAIDDFIIAAADADATAGVNGDLTVQFPTAQNIASGSTGMTINKLIEAAEILNSNEVSTMMPWTVVYGAVQLSNLLNDERISSADFNATKALTRGRVDEYLGFTHVRSQRLGTNAGDGDARKCFAYAMDAITLGVAQEPTSLMGDRTDKDHAIQLYTYMLGGAVRVEEELIVRINCTEA